MGDRFFYGFGDELGKLAADMPKGPELEYESDLKKFKQQASSFKVPKSGPSDPLLNPYPKKKDWIPLKRSGAKAVAAAGQKVNKEGDAWRKRMGMTSPKPGLNLSRLSGRKQYDAPELGSLSHIRGGKGSVLDDLQPVKRSKPQQEAWKRLEARKKKGPDYSSDEGISKFVGQHTKGSKARTGRMKRRAKKPMPKPKSQKEWLAQRMERKDANPAAKWLHGKLKGTAWAPGDAAIKRHREGPSKAEKKWDKVTGAPSRLISRGLSAIGSIGRSSPQQSVSRTKAKPTYTEHLQSKPSGLQKLTRSAVSSKPYTAHRQSIPRKTI